jgi:hypothetical protein
MTISVSLDGTSSDRSLKTTALNLLTYSPHGRFRIHKLNDISHLQ